MATPAPTHINAYLAELNEAETAVVAAQARVAELQKQINQRLAENNQDPMFDENGKPKKSRRATAPAGATGFGTPRSVSVSNPRVDEDGNA
jgi:hypothetical protein